jgi:hypothetical protein
LRDGRLRDGKTFSERRHSGFATGELLEDGEACWVGEGLKENSLAFVGHIQYISKRLY